MRISSTYTLPANQQRAYEARQDPVLLARSMPGCDRLDKVGEDIYEMKVKMVLGHVTADRSSFV